MFKKATKRVEDGWKLCNELVQMIQERSVIEKSYAKSLQTWSQKWNNCIDKGPEYGTTEAAWKAVLKEAQQIGQLHSNIKDKLNDHVIGNIKEWQKDKYHKGLLTVKEKKDLDEEFKRVQKPWLKLLDEVDRAKNDFHGACRNERTLKIQERNACLDTSVSPDQLKKIQDKLSHAKDEVCQSRERYDIALAEISQYSGQYSNEMSQVFEQCQEFEKQRLDFFKDILFNLHDCLDISVEPELPQIYQEYRHAIQNADSDKDLQWWAETCGTECLSIVLPQFEPFSEEFREIIKDTKAKRVHATDEGITLINHLSKR